MKKTQETLIELFNLDKMPPEKMVEMVDRLSKLVFQSVLVRVLPTLSEEDMKRYEELIESQEDGEAIFKFLENKVPDFGEIIKEEAEDLKLEIAEELTSAGLR